MNCPHCASTETTECAKKTVMGYRTFCCQQCTRTFNEATGTPFNYLEYPTDIVLLVVRVCQEVWLFRTCRAHLSSLQNPLTE